MYCTVLVYCVTNAVSLVCTVLCCWNWVSFSLNPLPVPVRTLQITQFDWHFQWKRVNVWLIRSLTHSVTVKKGPVRCCPQKSVSAYIIINYIPAQIRDFKWDFGWNFHYVTLKITKPCQGLNRCPGDHGQWYFRMHIAWPMIPLWSNGWFWSVTLWQATQLIKLLPGRGWV